MKIEEQLVVMPAKDERRAAIVRIMSEGNVVHPVEVSHFLLTYDRWLRETRRRDGHDTAGG